jgi:two-component system chemotaxis response regulator CheY
MPTRKLVVIVADDVDYIRQLIERWLTDLGHEVHLAPTGNAVLKLLFAHRVDLVVTDILMPDGDGLEVLTAMGKIQPWARVLAISGGGRYMPAVDCLSVANGLGAHHTLLKPFERKQFMEALSRAMAAAPPDAGPG